MKNNKILISLASLFLALSSILICIIGVQIINKNPFSTENKTLIISGEGKASYEPNIATLNLGHTSEDLEPAKAQKDNQEVIDKMQNTLEKEFEIDKKDMQTSDYSLYPRYDWINNVRVLKGYEVRQSIKLKVRKLDQLSSILEAAGKLGLNNINGPIFDVDDIEKIKAEAREKAFLNAKQKAEDYSKLANIKLGKIINIAETYNTSSGYPTYYGERGGAGGGGYGGAGAVAVGENEVGVSVGLSYELY